MLVPAEFSDRKVCVLGLGYVGLTLAAVLADVGFVVTGVEIRGDVVSRLRGGDPHFHEPGLKALLERIVRQRRLSIESTVPNDCAATVFIITVGTPLDNSGRARLDMIEHVAREVAARMKPGDLVIMRSTVKIGTTRKVVVPILDAAKVAYDLAFCPERTLEGQALMELRALPQIVGGATHAGNIRASQLFQFVTPTVVRVSSLETAEMIKLIDNTQRDVSFAFANEVARICDGASVSAAEVIRAGKLGYARTNLPMPGPVGGPCLEKDPHILVEGMQELGITPELTMAARRLNERQPGETVSALRRTAAQIGNFPANPVIALLGLAFKGRPATDDLRGTMARPILAELKRAWPNARFRGWDAVVAEADINAFGVEAMPSLESAMAGAHLAIVANNHPVFAAMAINSLAERMARPSLIYDFWNNFNANDLIMPPGTGYMALGSHSSAVIPGAAT